MTYPELFLSGTPGLLITLKIGLLAFVIYSVVRSGIRTEPARVSVRRPSRNSRHQVWKRWDPSLP